MPLPRLFHALRSNSDRVILFRILHYRVWTPSRFYPTRRRYLLLSHLVLTLSTQTFDSLKDLITAAHLWDSTVHEAINVLEVEESMYVAPSDHLSLDQRLLSGLPPRRPPRRFALLSMLLSRVHKPNPTTSDTSLSDSLHPPHSLSCLRCMRRRRL